MTTSKVSSPQAGFTLLEVLLVITLLFFLSITTFQSVRRIIAAKEGIDYRTAVVQMQRAVFSLLERDLRLAFHHVAEDFVWQPKTPDPESPEAELPPPVKPKPVSIFQGKGAEIFFTTKSHQRMSADSPENEQHFVTYQLHENALVRAESDRAVAEADREDRDKFKKVVLMANVTKLEFRYYDARSDRWQESWDTEGNDTRDFLPSAVQIELQYTPDVEETERRKPEPVTFKTSYILTEPLFRKPGAGVAPSPAPASTAGQVPGAPTLPAPGQRPGDQGP